MVRFFCRLVGKEVFHHAEAHLRDSPRGSDFVPRDRRDGRSDGGFESLERDERRSVVLHGQHRDGHRSLRLDRAAVVDAGDRASIRRRSQAEQGGLTVRRRLAVGLASTLLLFGVSLGLVGSVSPPGAILHLKDAKADPVEPLYDASKASRLAQLLDGYGGATTVTSTEMTAYESALLGEFDVSAPIAADVEAALADARIASGGLGFVTEASMFTPQTAIVVGATLGAYILLTRTHFGGSVDHWMLHISGLDGLFGTAAEDPPALTGYVNVDGIQWVKAEGGWRLKIPALGGYWLHYNIQNTAATTFPDVAECHALENLCLAPHTNVTTTHDVSFAALDEIWRYLTDPAYPVDFVPALSTCAYSGSFPINYCDTGVMTDSYVTAHRTIDSLRSVDSTEGTDEERSTFDNSTPNLTLARAKLAADANARQWTNHVLSPDDDRYTDPNFGDVVPNCFNMSVSSCESAIDIAGFTGSYTVVTNSTFSSSVDPGKVVSTNPHQGDGLPSSGTITLRKNPAGDMPDCFALTVGDCEDSVGAAGFTGSYTVKLGRFHSTYADDGTVIGTAPGKNSPLAGVGTVTLTTNPSLEESGEHPMPDCVGITYVECAELMRAAGILGQITLFTDWENDGLEPRVIRSTSPAVGVPQSTGLGAVLTMQPSRDWPFFSDCDYGTLTALECAGELRQPSAFPLSPPAWQWPTPSPQIVVHEIPEYSTTGLGRNADPDAPGCTVLYMSVNGAEPGVATSDDARALVGMYVSPSEPNSIPTTVDLWLNFHEYPSAPSAPDCDLVLPPP
jgi:hypothetical protein